VVDVANILLHHQVLNHATEALAAPPPPFLLPYARQQTTFPTKISLTM